MGFGGWEERMERGMIFAVGEVSEFRQKSDGTRTDDTYETVTYRVRSVLIVDEWMWTEYKCGNIENGYHLRVQNAMRSWYLAPRGRPRRSSR